MFPELPIAAALVLAAPIWALSLYLDRRPLAAIFLFVSASGLGYAAFRAIRANHVWGAYASIVGILIVGSLVASTAP